MSVQNTINKLEAHVANLEKEKSETEEKIGKLKRNALTNKTRGNINAAKQKIRLFMMHEKRLINLNGMIYNANVMISKLLQTQVNKVSSILSRPLMKMSAENEAALEAQMEAISRNAAATPSAEHASYLRNMGRGLANASAAAGAPVAAPDAAPDAVPARPPNGSPAYYQWLTNTQPELFERVNASVVREPGPVMTGPGIPVMGVPPRVGGKSRRMKGKRKASRRRLTRRRH